MRAGLLRERLSFQTKIETTSAEGIVSASWTTIFTVWGRVKQEDGRADEATAGDRPMAQTRLTMIIRHRSDVRPDMRVVWRGRVFEITGLINRDERRETMDLMVIERKSP